MDEIRCPHCNSKDTRKQKMSAKWFLISVFLLGIPLPNFKKRYFCFDCSTEFKLNSSKKKERDDIIDNKLN